MKPGVKTSEFWAALFTNALGLYDLLTGGLNVANETVIVVLAVINGAYAASRGLAKVARRPAP